MPSTGNDTPAGRKSRTGDTVEVREERRNRFKSLAAEKQARNQPGSERSRVERGKSAGTAGTGPQPGSERPSGFACDEEGCGNVVQPEEHFSLLPNDPVYCKEHDPSRQAATAPDAAGLPADMNPDDRLMARQKADRLRVEQAARDIVARERAAAGWAPPPEVGFGYLDDLLTAPPRKQPYLVDGLLGRGHNAVLAAPYKTGKTTLGLNLARSLVDGLPFLGRETFLPEGARVGWLNAEMDDADWLDYARPLRIANPGDVAVLNMRGWRLPILNDIAAEWFVNWLKRYEVGALVIDSWRRLCSWSRISENDNEGVERLTDRLDEIKQQSGVAGLLLLAHTGRKRHEDGEEHARGATALDDWVDARWIMAKGQGGVRYFYAEGRRVRLDEAQLVFDEAYNEVTMGEGSRADRRRQGKEATAALDAKLVRVVLSAASEGMSAGELDSGLEAAGITQKQRRATAMRTAVETGLATVQRAGKRSIYMAS